MPYIGIPPRVSSKPGVSPEPLRRTLSSPDLTARGPHPWDGPVDRSTGQPTWVDNPNSIPEVHQQNDTPPASSQDNSPQDSPSSEASGAASQATAAQTSGSSIKRRSSVCESVIVSWPKPGKVAILGYGNRQMAEDLCSQLNGDSPASGPRKTLCGYKATAILAPEYRPNKAPRPDGAPQAPQAPLPSRVASQVAVFFGPLPGTTDDALRRSIRTELRPSPRQVIMGKYTATIDETRTAVESTLRDVGPFESFYMFDDSTKTRLEAAVPFPDPEDALGAYRKLNQTPLPPFPPGELRVHLHDHNECSSVRCHKKVVRM